VSKVEEQIQQAIADGRFDDLPGKGRPLRLDDNPYEDPEWSLAYHMLRSSGFTLPWIEAQREIQASIEEARRTLHYSWGWRARTGAEDAPPGLVDEEWAKALEKFRLHVAEINQRILTHNLEVPTEKFQLRPLSFEHELQLTISPPSDTL
jgi:DnaJ family protein C protein 28